LALPFDRLCMDFLYFIVKFILISVRFRKIPILPISTESQENPKSQLIPKLSNLEYNWDLVLGI
jgi:hypothetical protein